MNDSFSLNSSLSDWGFCLFMHFIVSILQDFRGMLVYCGLVAPASASTSVRVGLHWLYKDLMNFYLAMKVSHR